MQGPWRRTLVPQSGHSSQDALTNCCGEQPSHVTHPCKEMLQLVSACTVMDGRAAGSLCRPLSSQPACTARASAVDERSVDAAYFESSGLSSLFDSLDVSVF